MSESFSTGYAQLCEIRLLHHYWLDDGATIFDLIQKQEIRDHRLLTYDMRGFMSLRPTAATATVMSGLGCIFRETALGGIVAAPKDSVIPLDTALDFVVTITEGAFFNYTALTLRPRTIHEIFYQPEKKLYRYKENVPLLSNVTGASRATASGKALFLSKEIPALAADDQAEALVVSGNALLQLTSDQPGAATLQLSADIKSVPVFLNQNDAPAIVPPPGLTGAPARGIELTDDLPDDIFALLRLSAVRQDDADFSMVDNAGHPKAAHPVFQVRLKNRSTIWKYLNSSTGVLQSQEPNPLPLTYLGNAGSKQRPSVGMVKPLQSNGRVTEIDSEIFV